MRNIKLTKLEAEILYQCARQMSDDFCDYYSFLSKGELKKKTEAFRSGMQKLVEVFDNSKKVPIFKKP